MISSEIYLSSDWITGYGFHEDGLKVLYYNLRHTTWLPMFGWDFYFCGSMYKYKVCWIYTISNMTGIDACLQAGKAAAQDLLGKESGLLVNPKQMIPSWSEAGARLLVARFLGQYVSVGNLV